jgi:hypothetical protein
VRITLSGLLVSDAAAPPPSVVFGSVPAVSVSVLVSDMDATILRVFTPPMAAAAVVPVVVADQANSSFAFMSSGVTCVCISRVCELDATTGGALVMRVGGLGDLTQATLTCTIDGQSVAVNRVTPAADGLFDVIFLLPAPGASAEPSDVLTEAFMSVSTTAATVYAPVVYRRAPRVYLMQFSPDGSRVEIFFDQQTNGVGSAVDCAEFIEPLEQGSLGRNPVCTWDDSKQTLAVMLGNGAFINVGGTIDMLPDLVKSANGVSSWNLRQSVNVTAPQVVIPPT